MWKKSWNLAWRRWSYVNCIHVDSVLKKNNFYNFNLINNFMKTICFRNTCQRMDHPNSSRLHPVSIGRQTEWEFAKIWLVHFAKHESRRLHLFAERSEFWSSPLFSLLYTVSRGFRLAKQEDFFSSHFWPVLK